MTVTISPQQLAALIRDNRPIHLVDVRTPAEFREVHVQGARNLPLEHLNPQAIQSECCGSATEPLYVICRSGTRARQACEKLAAAGLTQAVCVEGGTQACITEGIAVVRGKKAISLERQVRILAGLLIVLGAVLGYFVHPLWIALSAFVGAGLVYAGVTDSCPMAMTLARMPWNQVHDVSSAGGPPAETSESNSCCT